MGPMTARWLTAGFLARLAEIDAQFWAERHDGPLLLEVHYKGGRPLRARIRDYVMPPVMLEVTIVASTS